MTVKVFLLFISHKSGDHSLTVHYNRQSLQDDLKSIVDSIKENHENTDEREIEADYNSDLATIEGAACDGFWAELSDSTWFDVFEKEIEVKESKMSTIGGKHPSVA